MKDKKEVLPFWNSFFPYSMSSVVRKFSVTKRKVDIQLTVEHTGLNCVGLLYFYFFPIIMLALHIQGFTPTVNQLQNENNIIAFLITDSKTWIENTVFSPCLVQSVDVKGPDCS